MRLLRPTSIPHAIVALANGVPLAGGTVLGRQIAEASGDEARTFVDLRGVPELSVLNEADGALHIGATVSLSRLASDPIVRDRYAALAGAALAVGNPLIRHAATIGGNLALRDPAGDLAAALLVLDGEVEFADGTGQIALPLERGFAEAPPRSLITQVRLRAQPTRRSAYVKFAWRRASGKTIVSIAASFDIDEGIFRAPKLAAFGLAPEPRRLPRAEEVLSGAPLSDSTLERAAAMAAAELPHEHHTSFGENYMRRLMAEGMRRVLREAME